jgi:hypothetical protein
VLVVGSPASRQQSRSNVATSLASCCSSESVVPPESVVPAPCGAAADDRVNRIRSTLLSVVESPDLHLNRAPANCSLRTASPIAQDTSRSVQSWPSEPRIFARREQRLLRAGGRHHSLIAMASPPAASGDPSSRSHSQLAPRAARQGRRPEPYKATSSKTCVPRTHFPPAPAGGRLRQRVK